MTGKIKIYKILIYLLAGLIIWTLLAVGALLAINDNPFESSEPVDVNEVVKGNTEFALELYGKLAEAPGAEGKNLFFSPYSISTALALTYAGARGNTEKQMAQVLHFGPAGRRIHPAFGLLEKQLNEKGAEGVFELTVANALWGQKDYKFLDTFIDLVNTNYSAGLNEVDFADTENARNVINKWVAEKTREKIKDLIKPGVLTRLTRLVLTNAIYFKGKWQVEFDKKDTRDTPFHTSARNTVTVPMMYLEEKFKYYRNDSLQILELGYKGDDLSMVVLLPKEVEGVKKIEKELSFENLEKWLEKLREQELKVYLPRFTFTSEFSLANVLSAMGMKDAFFLPPADFSGMTGTKELYISAVIHKAFVEVNEEGTEAAAATAVVMMTTSMRSPLPIFRADHPFIFMIKDNQTGSILFMGKVVDPSKK